MKIILPAITLATLLLAACNEPVMRPPDKVAQALKMLDQMDSQAATQPATIPATRPAAVLMPTDQELAALVQQLDAEDYPTREAATQKLKGVPREAWPSVQKALQVTNASPEVEARSQMILQTLEYRFGPKMTFIYQATPVDTILRDMSRSYGFVIISAQSINSPITVQNPLPLGAKDGITLINNMLFPLGYMSITNVTPDGYTILRVATIAEIKKAQIPVYLGAKAEDIPLNDQLITQIIPLRNIPANQIRFDLGPIISMEVDGNGGSGRASNTLVVTDTSAKIHQLVQIIEKLDAVGQKVTDAGRERDQPVAPDSDKQPTRPAPTMKFQFEATPIDAILTEMSRRYGFIIIQAQPINSKITVDNPSPLDAKAGIKLLNDLLVPLGYMAVATLTPDGHTVLRVMPDWIRK